MLVFINLVSFDRYVEYMTKVVIISPLWMGVTIAAYLLLFERRPRGF